MFFCPIHACFPSPLCRRGFFFFSAVVTFKNFNRKSRWSSRMTAFPEPPCARSPFSRSSRTPTSSSSRCGFFDHVRVVREGCVLPVEQRCTSRLGDIGTVVIPSNRGIGMRAAAEFSPATTPLGVQQYRAARFRSLVFLREVIFAKTRGKAHVYEYSFCPAVPNVALVLLCIF